MTPNSRPLPRRRFLRGVSLGAAALGAELTACSVDRLAPVPVPTAVPDGSRRQEVVRFANWPRYIDRAAGNPGKHPTLVEFTRRTGIAVDYTVPITASEQFLGQIGIPLALGEITGYDLVVLSGWMVAELVRLGWAETLSPRLVPNAARLLPEFRNWPIPDVHRYSLPWQAGFTGIAYNLKVTHQPVTTMRELLTAPGLRGRVSLVTDFRDVLGPLMLDLGINPADFGDAEFGAALALLAQSVRAGQIGMVTNYYLPALVKGTIGAAIAWAGDIIYIQQTHPEIGFTWPASGGMLWTDNMVIPALARHKENAERLMNYYYEPGVAARLSAYEEYLCPVLGAAAAMRGIDPGLSTQQYIFPTPAILRNGHYFKILTPKQIVEYTQSYQNAVGL
jgi:spermidine/putrescine-binding protein